MREMVHCEDWPQVSGGESEWPAGQNSNLRRRLKGQRPADLWRFVFAGTPRVNTTMLI